MINPLNDLATDVVVNGQIVNIRPIAGDDIEIEKQFVESLSPESRYFRFLGGVSGITDETAKALCEIDFDKKMAFIAVIKNAASEQQVIGVSRYASDEFDHCESAVSVADDWQNHGLGTHLMKALIEFARHKGKELIYSIDPIDNTHMRMLARDLGMTAQRDPNDAKMIRYDLQI
ncbi:MAG: GNAT superfamily N-acetyltransferase [Arenicella sp.]|jgi:GNAT superfamily N-acetyltransferase